MSPRAEQAGPMVDETSPHPPRSSVLPLKLDPRTKFLLMGFVAVAELMNGSRYFVMAVAAIPVLLLLQNRQYKIALWYLSLFVLGMLVMTYQGQLHLPMALNMIAVLLTGFVLRLAPAFAMAAYFVATTTASECVTSLGRIGVTRKITIPISVIFRFAPTIGEEFRSINDAMRMRGIRIGAGKFLRNPLLLLEYRFIPLVISLAKIGNELSAAALTRGLERPGDHTSIAQIGIRPCDIIVTALAVTLLTLTYFAA